MEESPQEAILLDQTEYWRYALPGAAAGMIAGLFGAGGGMILIPLIRMTAKPDEDTLFPSSVCIMLPICIATLVLHAMTLGTLPLGQSWPYMLGGSIGGILAGRLAKKIPTLWLHRGLGALIIWGGVRYLC